MACKYIVAIGFSAGGLEPLSTFFDYTPLDSAAYFVVQHLPYNYKSQLEAILKRHSDMQIVEARDRLKIAENQIYFAPPKMHIGIDGETIQTFERTETQPINRSFDIFLHSITKENAFQTIAVILSGGGEDGVKGIRNIKELGGRVIAQDPDTCRFPYMPANAITSGAVDYILKPEEMPAFIHKRVIHELEGPE
jgi:chemotaxis response regulator CheB